MKLRTKTLYPITIALIVVMALLYGVLRQIIGSGFTKVEMDMTRGFLQIEISEMHKNVLRVADALTSQSDNLLTKLSDWAQWDDTYRFVVDKNRAYIESNLTIDALTGIKINFICMFDISRKLVFDIGLDQYSQKEIPVYTSLLEHLSENPNLFDTISSSPGHSGIIMLPEAPLIFACRPIIKSNGNGPSHGTILFGKILDTAVFKDISSLTHLSTTFIRFDKSQSNPDFLDAIDSITPARPIYIKTLNPKQMCGYIVYNDAHKNPGIIIGVDVQRHINQMALQSLTSIQKRGDLTLLFIILSILLTGVVLAIVILFMLESAVLKRLRSLSNSAQEIGKKSDFSGKINVNGNDEITVLGTSINTMLVALASIHREISQKNAEIQLLMDTVPTGLLSLDEDLKVNPEFSHSVIEILGVSDLAGKDFFLLIGLYVPTDRAKLASFFDCLRNELLSESDMAGLNPFEEYHYHAKNCWLRFRYFLIRRGAGNPNHILVEIEDITRQKQLAEEIKNSHRENIQLKAIAENPDLFRDFMADTFRLMLEVKNNSTKLSQDSIDHAIVNDLFRSVHTIKGVSGSFGLFGVVEIASHLESMLAECSATTASTCLSIDQLNSHIALLSEAFNDVIIQTKNILGDEPLMEASTYVRVPLLEIKNQIAAIKHLSLPQPAQKEVLERIHRLQAISAKRAFAKTTRLVPGLVERLSKDVSFVFTGQDELIDVETAIELNTPLIHMIRNALDHGIESPDERLAMGKLRTGLVKLDVLVRNKIVTITLSDDGRGIDSEHIKRKAIEDGHISQEKGDQITDMQILELLFIPGFSTAPAITDVSGRGVGLDCAKQSVCNKLGGSITVQTQIKVGTTFAITIPLAEV